MPQLGNMKFPYTPAGKKRHQQIKNRLEQGRNRINKERGTPGLKLPKRPLPRIPGMYYPGGRKKLR